MSEPAKTEKRRGTGFSPVTRTVQGRPEGSRNRATILLQKLMADDAEAIVRKVISLAKGGDGLALKLCMERLIPPAKDRHIQLDFPRVHSAQDVIEASACLVQSVSRGNVSPVKRTQFRVCLRFTAERARRQALRNESQNWKGRWRMANRSVCGVAFRSWRKPGAALANSTPGCVSTVNMRTAITTLSGMPVNGHESEIHISEDGYLTYENFLTIYRCVCP